MHVDAPARAIAKSDSAQLSVNAPGTVIVIGPDVDRYGAFTDA